MRKVECAAGDPIAELRRNSSHDHDSLSARRRHRRGAAVAPHRLRRWGRLLTELAGPAARVGASYPTTTPPPALSDHHSQYLQRAVAALTPEGHRRVDELLEQLIEAVPGHPWLIAFAKAREEEADEGALAAEATDPVHRLTDDELERLAAGFITIRDQEPADDVGDWANAVIALLEDEIHRRPI